MAIFSLGGSSSSGNSASRARNAGIKSTRGGKDQQTTSAQTSTGSNLGTQLSDTAESSVQDIATNISNQSDVDSLINAAETQTSLSNTSQTTSGSSTRGATASGATTSATQSLDTGTQEVLRNLIASLSGDVVAGGAASTRLADRALTGDADLQTLIADIVAGARNKGERANAQAGVSAAQNAGSSMNSIVAQLGMESAVNLETQLAELEASLGLQTREQVTNELATVSGVAQSTAGNLAGLADVLKGAVTSGTTQEDSVTNELVSTLESLTGTTSGTVNTDTATAETRSEASTSAQTQAMTSLTDTLASIDTSSLSTETANAVQSLLESLSSTEMFSEQGESFGTKQEGSASFGFGT